MVEQGDKLLQIFFGNSLPSGDILQGNKAFVFMLGQVQQQS
jgi:hypothetical protein